MNLNGLPPLGTKRNTPPNKPLESNSTAFELIPEKKDRGKEMLSPLAVRRGIDSSAFESSPIPALKHSLKGKKLAPNQQTLAPLNTGNNDVSISSFPDPLSKPLQPMQKGLAPKKKFLAPLGVPHSNILHSDSPYNSPIKRRLGASRIISPMTKSRHNEIPMHILGVSRNNLNNTLRRPAASEQSEVQRKQYNLDGEFPSDDEITSSNKTDMHKTLRDVNMLRESGNRVKEMISCDGSSPFPNASPMRKTLRKKEPEYEPWSTTTGSTYIY